MPCMNPTEQWRSNPHYIWSKTHCLWRLRSPQGKLSTRLSQRPQPNLGYRVVAQGHHCKHGLLGMRHTRGYAMHLARLFPAALHRM